MIIDEGSTNGVLVDGARLPPHTPQVVRDGEVVRVGRCWLQIRMGAPPGGVAQAAGPAPRRARALAAELLERQLEAQGERLIPFLQVEAGPDAADRLELVEPGREYLVGRGRDADLMLTDELVSRRHVAVKRFGGSCSVRDLGSKRGSLLAGASLDERAVDWAVGAPLALGSTTLRFCSPIADALAEVVALADVQMRPAELHQRPPGAAVQGPGDPAGGETPTVEPAAEAEGSAPPHDERAPLVETEPAGCISFDVFVVLVALAVLGLSIVGLMWVLR